MRSRTPIPQTDPALLSITPDPLARTLPAEPSTTLLAKYPRPSKVSREEDEEEGRAYSNALFFLIVGKTEQRSRREYNAATSVYIATKEIANFAIAALGRCGCWKIPRGSWRQLLCRFDWTCFLYKLQNNFVAGPRTVSRLRLRCRWFLNFGNGFARISGRN